jgi:hypothetical protein
MSRDLVKVSNIHFTKVLLLGETLLREDRLTDMTRRMFLEGACNNNYLSFAVHGKLIRYETFVSLQQIIQLFFDLNRQFLFYTPSIAGRNL